MPIKSEPLDAEPSLPVQVTPWKAHPIPLISSNLEMLPEANKEVRLGRETGKGGGGGGEEGPQAGGRREGSFCSFADTIIARCRNKSLGSGASG